MPQSDGKNDETTIVNYLVTCILYVNGFILIPHMVVVMMRMTVTYLKCLCFNWLTISNKFVPFLQHNRFLLDTKEKEPDVVFIGDSLIQRLVHTEMWNNFFAPMHALNFGIGGDLIQNVLWRIENGELDHINPKVIRFYYRLIYNVVISEELFFEQIFEHF